MATISTHSNDLISTTSHFLPKIVKTAVRITDKVQEAKVNDQRSQILLGRIHMIIAYLWQLELVGRLQSKNDLFNRTLEHFHQFLEKCETFKSNYTVNNQQETISDLDHISFE